MLSNYRSGRKPSFCKDWRVKLKQKARRKKLKFVAKPFVWLQSNLAPNKGLTYFLSRRREGIETNYEQQVVVFFLPLFIFSLFAFASLFCAGFSFSAFEDANCWRRRNVPEENRIEICDEKSEYLAVVCLPK